MHAIKRTKSVGTTLILIAALMSLAGCPKQEGPAERAGKEIDKATEKAGQQVEKAGQSIQNAVSGDRK